MMLLQHLEVNTMIETVSISFLTHGAQNTLGQNNLRTTPFLGTIQIHYFFHFKPIQGKSNVPDNLFSLFPAKGSKNLKTQFWGNFGPFLPKQEFYQKIRLVSCTNMAPNIMQSIRKKNEPILRKLNHRYTETNRTFMHA